MQTFEYMKFRFALVFGVIALMSPFFVYADEASSSVLVHLTVVASSTQLFDGDVNTVACDSDGAGTLAFTGYCAVSQAEASSSWSWWGSDAFLDSVNGVTNDNANGWYWGWFSNLTYGETALNKYTLAAGDRLLVLLNSSPLRLSVSNATPTVGDTIIFTVEEFGYDASWNPVWKPSPSSSLMIGAVGAEPTASGTYALVVTATDPISVYAHRAGNFVQSPTLMIVPVAAPVAQSSGGGSGSPELAAAVKPEFKLARAVAFLLDNQATDGSFGDQMYTDWATVALKAAVRAGNSDAQAGLEKVRQYLADKSISKSVSLTDYERHALALMSAGINPYTGTGVNYIQKIIDEFDGEQFGDASLENDDIFALLVLLKAGYKAEDEMIRKSTAFLLGRQKSSGAWIGTDVTAAAIQALRPLQAIEGVASALELAEEYVISNQQGDGGFGNIYSLSWALQVLGGRLPGADDALAVEQQEDGGFRETSVSAENRLWATAYAIPGALHKSWPEIMQSFKKVEAVKKDEVRDEEREVIEASEPEPVIEAATMLPALPVTQPQTVSRVTKAADVPTPVVTELKAEDSATGSAESAPFVASVFEVTKETSLPLIPIGLTLLGVLVGFFVLRVL